MAFTITSSLSLFFLKPWVGKLQGAENIPKDKGAIFCANHASYMDHFIIGAYLQKATGDVPNYLAKKEHFDKFFERKWHEFLRAIPVDREAGGKEALKKAIEHLRNGGNIMIYPEGTRTLTGKLNRAKTGVARLALAAKVPVVPMGVTNTFDILPKGQKFPKGKKKADLNIGKPLSFEKYYGKDDDPKVLRTITTKIMKEIAKLSRTTYNFD